MLELEWADLIAVGALVFSAYQFYRENYRKKMLSTLEAYNQLQGDVFTGLNQLLLKQEHNDRYFDTLKTGYADWESTSNYLARIERFSVGINSNIYCIRTLNRLGGGYFIRIFMQLKPIINKKRKDNISKGAHYDEFEMVVNKLQKMRGKSIY